MSKINIFSNTIIQTNGTASYILRTIERTGSLKHVEIESKTNDTINIDLSDIVFDSVAIKDGSDLGETTLLWIRDSMNTQTWTLVDNRIITCDDELKEQYADELQFLVSKGYNIDIPATKNYLRFTNVSDEIQTVECKISNHGFEYNKNGNEWTVWNTDEVITLNPDEYMEIRGNGYTAVKYSLTLGFVFNNDNAYIEASGDVTSLINGEGGDATLTFYQFNSLFRNCKALVQAPELPSTELAAYCYYYMFNGCTSLTAAPELPATTLADYCYYGMFSVCTRLTTVSELNATRLASGCYSSMFMGCSKLVEAPELPATTIASSCYTNMFYNCSSLTTGPSILPATELFSGCYTNMFYGCRQLTTAPVLPATTLVSNCYSSMFSACSKLNYVKISAETPSPLNMNNWLSNVASTGTLEITNNILEVSLNDFSSCPPGWDVVRSA